MLNHDQTIKQRAQSCVCKFCGGTLEARFIIFNKYGGQGLELYCPRCQRIEYGVRPAIFQLAEQFVDTFAFNYYPDMEEDDDANRLNIAKIAEILTWAAQQSDENGDAAK